MLTKQAELSTINAIQSIISESNLGWTAGITSVSQLSAEDKRIMAGGRISPLDVSIPLISVPEGVGDFPSSFDWRNKDGKDWMTPIGSQGRCGSCWAFSVSGIIEACYNIYSSNSNLNIDVSEQHVVSSCCNVGDCGGGWPDWVLRYVRDTGVPDEACFPYIRRDSACTPCADWEDRVYKIESYAAVNHTKDSYKQAIMDYGPISVCILVPDDWYYYRSGVYTPTWVSEGVGWANHAVSIIGWDDSDDCWIIRNSYGTGWGESGYGRVKYGDVEKYRYAYAITGIDIETNVLPTAIASATPLSGTTPLTVQFTGSGTDPDGTIQSYEWNFGDNTSSNEQNPSHTYTTGVYSPTLTVTDNNGATGTDSISIDVVDHKGVPCKTLVATKSESANIVATNIIVTPTICEVPCKAQISVTWENKGNLNGTFLPGYTINGTLYSEKTYITLRPGQVHTLGEEVTISSKGTYKICPYPNE